MANIVKNWKRFMATGCSHGIYEDSSAVAAMLKWCADFKPHTKVHLGDFMDTTAFRGGATGSPDESVSIREDGMAAKALFDAYEPDLIFIGNHEDRLWKLRHHSKEIVKLAAQTIIDSIEDMAEKHHAELVPYSGIADSNSWRLLGGTAFGHGYIYNVNACRDTAEYMGRDVVFAHTHTVKQQKGRCIGSPTGYCVGTLCRIPAMAYAKSRRATAGWAMGWAYGEYAKGGQGCHVNLYELRRSDAETTIPTAKCAKRSKR